MSKQLLLSQRMGKAVTNILGCPPQQEASLFGFRHLPQGTSVDRPDCKLPKAPRWRALRSELLPHPQEAFIGEVRFLATHRARL